MGRHAALAAVVVSGFVLAGCSNLASIKVQEMSGDDLSLAYLAGVSSQAAATANAARYCAEIERGAPAVLATAPADVPGLWDWVRVDYRCGAP